MKILPYASPARKRWGPSGYVAQQQPSLQQQLELQPQLLLLQQQLLLQPQLLLQQPQPQLLPQLQPQLLPLPQPPQQNRIIIRMIIQQQPEPLLFHIVKYLL
jgi:hypothetical protein